MAMLYVKTPNETTKSINLETMNIESGAGSNYSQWIKLPNNLILQYGWSETTKSAQFVKSYFPISFSEPGSWKVFLTVASFKTNPLTDPVIMNSQYQYTSGGLGSSTDFFAVGGSGTNKTVPDTHSAYFFAIGY